MSIPIPIHKDNADEKARRVRLLRIWTDICAMALCEMPEGRSENSVECSILSCPDTEFWVFVASGCHTTKFNERVYASDPDAEEKLADIQRRLKPYVA